MFIYINPFYMTYRFLRPKEISKIRWKSDFAALHQL